MEIKESIKTWALEDRPREKYLAKGVNSLTNAELVAILLGSGYKDKSALTLSKELLSSINNNLDELFRLNLKDLTKFKGIGEVKAISLIVAFELGRRRKIVENKIDKISSSMDVFKILGPKLQDLMVEEFHIVLLNRTNKILSIQKISEGGTAATIVDPKIIFKKALDYLAHGIILVHNHPSGNLRPSEADMSITKKLKSFGEFIDVNILDHLIIANNNYFSFADENLM
jgi:DNA repair protein RadC